MKKLAILLFLGLFLKTKFLYAQDWESIETPSDFIAKLYTDSITDKMYLIGRFRYIDSVEFRGQAKWDGKTFSKFADVSTCQCDSFNCCASYHKIRRAGSKLIFGPLDDGQLPVANVALAEVVDSAWLPVMADFDFDSGHPYYWTEINGELFVVGAFEKIDSVQVGSVASFDGQKWKGWNFPKSYDGATPLLSCIEFYKGKLIVGGNMVMGTPGNITTDIAVYENGSWLPLGGGIKGGLSGVWGMVIYHDELYVYGRFFKAEGNKGNCVMRWDGNQWKDVGGGVCDSGGTIFEMKIINDKLYAVGSFECVGDGLPANRIAFWDGEKWCTVGTSTFDNTITTIDAYKGDIYIGGGFTLVNGLPLQYLAKFIGDPADNICGTVAAKTPDTAADNLQITPNPATQAIRITLPTNPATLKISVFNTLGQPMLSKTIENLPEPAIVLEVGGWPSGVYFVEIRTEDGQVWGGRFVKG